nr:VanZ family protein [Jeotgalicoccus pinnipedialis]
MLEAFKPIIPIFIITLMVFLFVLMFINYKIGYRLNNFKRILLFVTYFGLIMTIVGIFLVTMMPTSIENNSLNLKPFSTIQDLLNFATREAIFNNIIMNIVLFMPFGFFMYLALRRELLVSLIGMSLSVLVETLQFIFPIGRTSNIDDVILNVIGTIIGIIIGVIFLKIEQIYDLYFGRKSE